MHHGVTWRMGLYRAIQHSVLFTIQQIAIDFRPGWYHVPGSSLLLLRASSSVLQCSVINTTTEKAAAHRHFDTFCRPSWSVAVVHFHQYRLTVLSVSLYPAIRSVIASYPTELPSASHSGPRRAALTSSPPSGPCPTMIQRSYYFVHPLLSFCPLYKQVARPVRVRVPSTQYIEYNSTLRLSPPEPWLPERVS